MKSPLLDVWSADESQVDLQTGYFDNVLAIFEKNRHPFILIGELAMRWHSCCTGPDKETDVLVKSSQIDDIAFDLVYSGNWTLCSNPYLDSSAWLSYINTTEIRETWLQSQNQHVPFFGRYLRLWPEELYQLSVEKCQKFEIPDLSACWQVTFEECYYRDPKQLFGPDRLSVREQSQDAILPPVSRRCKWIQRRIPLYVPSIADHLNALLDQEHVEFTDCTRSGNIPSTQVHRYIRYHCWDWPPATQWLLKSGRIHQRNILRLRHRLENHRRIPRLEKDRASNEFRSMLPWERT